MGFLDCVKLTDTDMMQTYKYKIRKHFQGSTRYNFFLGTVIQKGKRYILIKNHEMKKWKTEINVRERVLLPFLEL